MRCDHKKSTVLESRIRADGLRYRRRYCQICQSNFSTIEISAEWVKSAQLALFTLAKTFS